MRRACSPTLDGLLIFAFALTALSAAAAICAAALRIVLKHDIIPFAKPLLIYAPALYILLYPAFNAVVIKSTVKTATNFGIHKTTFYTLYKALS